MIKGTKITIFRNFTVFRIIRQAALNMIRQTPKERMGVKRMRKAALTGVLAQNVF